MSSIHKIVENVSLKREFYRQGVKLVYGVIFRGLYRGNESGFRKLQTAKSPVRQYRAFHLFGAWQFPTLAWGDPTLPSAL
ncbi:hypothetical protein, partial [Buttiauxella noackiae]|uniref:hypothetical protein n=1 Tax=Buttiauxella noackiae TaxID=82992 RepID=UPI0028D04133